MTHPAARRRTTPLETVYVEVPEAALEPYEAALTAACATVGFFLIDEALRTWRIEGVREQGFDEPGLRRNLVLAAMLTGVEAELGRNAVEAEGWIARTRASFPPLPVGRRFLVRGTHETGRPPFGRVTLTLDAGVAFGSGEHGSTMGCLRALELVARRRPGWRKGRIADVGTGSGILAIGAAKLLRRPVVATDIDPWSVRVTRQNAALNGVTSLVRPVLADGWRAAALHKRFGLVLANILARPLCRMAPGLFAHLAPGGTAILSGLLTRQVRMVLAAHRSHGLVLERVLREGDWATLMLRRPARQDQPRRERT